MFVEIAEYSRFSRFVVTLFHCAVYNSLDESIVRHAAKMSEEL